MTAVEAARTRLPWLESETANLVFKVIAVISLVASLFVGTQQYRLTSCLAAYNEASNANTQLRSQAAADERAALDSLISSIDEARSLPAGQGKSALDIAFRDYATTRARIEGKREVAPIPGPPSQTCG